MTSIAFELPEEIARIADSVEAFCKREVIARHAAHHEELNDPRRLFREDGRLSDAAVEHMRQVRMASARAGFYNVAVPVALTECGFR